MGIVHAERLATAIQTGRPGPILVSCCSTPNSRTRIRITIDSCCNAWRRATGSADCQSRRRAATAGRRDVRQIMQFMRNAASEGWRERFE